MSRRNSSTLKDIYDLFVLAPWWVPFAVASFVYVIFSFVIPAFDRNNMLNLLSKIVGNYLSSLILLVGVCSWIGKWWRNTHELNANMSAGIRRKTNDSYLASGLVTIPWWNFPIIGMILCTIIYSFTISHPISVGSSLSISMAPLNIFLIPFILVSSCIMAYQSYTITNGRQEMLEKHTSIGSIQQLNWKQFEVLVGAYYRKQGYQVVENLNDGADGGVDLRLHKDGTKTIVQCKHWKSAKVGVKEIREFYGILMHEQAKQAIYITSGVYTEEAKVFAQGKSMVLIDGRQLTAMITSVNGNIAPQQATPLQSSIPACPKCGSEMIIRRARKGDTAGSDFWGCTNYPRCRGTRPT